MAGMIPAGGQLPDISSPRGPWRKAWEMIQILAAHTAVAFAAVALFELLGLFVRWLEKVTHRELIYDLPLGSIIGAGERAVIVVLALSFVWEVVKEAKKP